MKILTLIENTSADDKLIPEHGVSFFIERRGRRFLFDTGASDRFMKNAARMKTELTLDAVILSHNQAENAGGIESVLKKYPSVTVYARQGVKGDFFLQESVFQVPIGIPKAVFDRRRENFVLFNKFQEVSKGIYLLSNEVFDEEYEAPGGKNYYARYAGESDSGQKKRLTRADFRDELFMAVFPTAKTEGGCVVIMPCAHAGVVNMLRTVRLCWPNVPILGVIAGFHFMGNSQKQLLCSPEYIDAVAEELAKMELGQIYACHCTGGRGYDRLKLHLGDQIQYLRTGEELVFN
ncbi:MBL fold hydrolase [Clostridia bacterium]|nr:MBL fold hydrolase [Clostridia bacterium]